MRSRACQWHVRAASFRSSPCSQPVAFLIYCRSWPRQACSAPASSAIAADASPWDDDLQSAARLIAARAHNESGGRVFRAGVEIKLKEGWKTYWRYPGDSGVPPVLDFSRSQNVKAVTVLYPAPMRFPDGAGGNVDRLQGRRDPAAACRAAGCRQAGDAQSQARLCGRAKSFACPPRPSWNLLLTGGRDRQRGHPQRGRGAGAEACGHRRRRHAGDPRGPPRSGIGQAACRRRCRRAGRCAVDVVRRRANAAVGIAAAANLSPVRRRGQQRFAFELDGLPPGEKADGAVLRLTAVSGDRAVEVAFRLD